MGIDFTPYKAIADSALSKIGFQNPTEEMRNDYLGMFVHTTTGRGFQAPYINSAALTKADATLSQPPDKWFSGLTDAAGQRDLLGNSSSNTVALGMQVFIEKYQGNLSPDARGTAIQNLAAPSSVFNQTYIWSRPNPADYRTNASALDYSSQRLTAAQMGMGNETHALAAAFGGADQRATGLYEQAFGKLNAAEIRDLHDGLSEYDKNGRPASSRDIGDSILAPGNLSNLSAATPQITRSLNLTLSMARLHNDAGHDLTTVGAFNEFLQRTQAPVAEKGNRLDVSPIAAPVDQRGTQPPTIAPPQQTGANITVVAKDVPPITAPADPRGTQPPTIAPPQQTGATSPLDKTAVAAAPAETVIMDAHFNKGQSSINSNEITKALNQTSGHEHDLAKVEVGVDATGSANANARTLVHRAEAGLKAISGRVGQGTGQLKNIGTVDFHDGSGADLGAYDVQADHKGQMHYRHHLKDGSLNTGAFDLDAKSLQGELRKDLHDPTPGQKPQADDSKRFIKIGLGGPATP